MRSPVPQVFLTFLKVGVKFPFLHSQGRKRNSRKLETNTVAYLSNLAPR